MQYFRFAATIVKGCDEGLCSIPCVFLLFNMLLKECENYLSEAVLTCTHLSMFYSKIKQKW